MAARGTKSRERSPGRHLADLRAYLEASEQLGTLYAGLSRKKRRAPPDAILVLEANDVDGHGA